MDSINTAECYCIKVRDIALSQDTLDESKIVQGSPEIYSTVLSSSYNGNIIRGVWKCTVGTVTDVEEDEMFTVIEGRATVHVEGGRTLELSSGCMGEFKKGDKTTWIIHEDILKTFQITLYDDS